MKGQEQKSNHFSRICYTLVILLIPIVFIFHIAEYALTTINTYFATSTLDVDKFKIVFDACIKETTLYYGLYIGMIVVNYIVSMFKKNILLLLVTIIEVVAVALFTYPFDVWQHTALLIIPAFANIFLYLENS